MTARLDDLKRQAALAAARHVENGAVVGLGTGTTAKHVILALGERLKSGLRVTGVPTSQETAALAESQGIPLLAPDVVWTIDVTLDGADQVDPQFNLIKGGGGALLKEKIVAAASKKLIVVIDYTKQVPVLGHSFPLPIEVTAFGWAATARQLERLGLAPVLRQRDQQPYRTESGNYILDVPIPRIDDPAGLERQLTLIPGVVETGLFVGRTDLLIVGTPDGVRELEPKEPHGSV